MGQIQKAERNIVLLLFFLLFLLSSCSIKCYNTDVGGSYSKYICKSTNTIKDCYSLSSGIGTRCYNELKTSYSSCSVGWTIYEDTNDCAEYRCYSGKDYCRLHGLIINEPVKRIEVCGN